MIIAFTGHRDKHTNEDFFDCLPHNALWVHGGAIGFDTQVERYAEAHSIKTKIIRPNYEKYGKQAPLLRNHEILKGADLLVACYDGRSGGGTLYTIRLAKSMNIPIRYTKALSDNTNKKGEIKNETD
jgi:hypothetical protein